MEGAALNSSKMDLFPHTIADMFLKEKSESPLSSEISLPRCSSICRILQNGDLSTLISKQKKRVGLASFLSLILILLSLLPFLPSFLPRLGIMSSSRISIQFDDKPTQTHQIRPPLFHKQIGIDFPSPPLSTISVTFIFHSFSSIPSLSMAMKKFHCIIYALLPFPFSIDTATTQNAIAIAVTSGCYVDDGHDGPVGGMVTVPISS